MGVFTGRGHTQFRRRGAWLRRRFLLPALVLVLMADLPIIETVHPALAAPIQGAFAPTPYSFEFTGEDRLRLTVFNSVSGVRVAVHVRMHRRTAPTHATRYEFAPTSDRLASSQELEIGEGYLLNVSCFASSGTPQSGQTFVKLQVIRGSAAAAVVLGTIVQGYVTANQDLAWPGSPLRSSIDGDGVLRYIVGTDQAAGVEVSETVPPGARWQLLTFQVDVTFSVVPGNRIPCLRLDALGVQYVRIPPAAAGGPGDSDNFYWLTGLGQVGVIAPGQVVTGLPTRYMLPSGHHIQTETVGLNAGDNFQAPRFTVLEWLEAQ